MSFFTIFIETFSKFQSPEIYEFPGAKIILGAIGIISGVIALAAFIALAIFRDKGKVLAVIAGIANFLTLALMPAYIKAFHTLELVLYNPSIDDLIEQLTGSIGVLAVSYLMFFALILNIIYFIGCFKMKPFFFALAAVLLTVVRYLAVMPYQLYVPFFLKLTNPYVEPQLFYYGQIFQLALYCAITVLPVVIVLIPAILNKVKSPAPAVEEIAE